MQRTLRKMRFMRPPPRTFAISTLSRPQMRLAEIYQCFCDENRLRTLNLLTNGPLCGCHFQDILKLTQVKISKRLAYLRERQLVECHREQNWMVYSLPKNPP